MQGRVAPAAVLRGGVAGIATFLVVATLLLAVVVGLGGDATTDLALDSEGSFVFVLWTLLALAAVAGGAVGTWQAAQGGAPTVTQAVRIGAGGVLVVALIGLLTGLDDPFPAVASTLFIAVGAVAGALGLARRLEAG